MSKSRNTSNSELPNFSGSNKSRLWGISLNLGNRKLGSEDLGNLHMLVWCLEKVSNIFPKWHVKNGDESNGIQFIKTSPKETNTRICMNFESKNYQLDVSENRDTPKWMVKNGNPYKKGWFGGTPIFGNTQLNKQKGTIGEAKIYGNLSKIAKRTGTRCLW